MVTLPVNKASSYSFVTPPHYAEDNLAYYSLEPSVLPIEIGLTWQAEPPAMEDPEIQVIRYITGFGGERGGIETVVSNNGYDAVNISLFQLIPDYLYIYLHTLRVSPKDEVAVHYQPSLQRVRPTILQLDTTIQPKSKWVARFDFDKAFIRYTEHPPDAEHGFDMAAAIVTTRGVHTYSRNLVVNLPTPDFSMPYNVITLTCTVLALLFGSIFNLAVRSYSAISQ